MRLLRKNYVYFIITNFLIFSVVLLIFISIEGYLRTRKAETKPYGITFYSHHGKRISPNKGPLKLCTAPYTIFKNLPNQKTENFTTNSLGFRGRENSALCVKEKRIIVVGGSCAFGTGLKNDNETFQVMLEKLNNKYEVINAGVAGFLSGQELTYIVTELVDYHPDIIIAFDGYNDMFFTWYHDRWFGHLRKKNEMGFNYSVFFNRVEAQLVDNCRSRERIFHSFNRFCNTVVNKSLLVMLIREKIARIKKGFHIVQSSDSKADSEENKNDYFEDIVDTYTRNLKKMNDFCHNQGIKLLVVFQPEVGLKSNISSEERRFLSGWSYLYSNYENEFPNLYRHFIERSKKVLAEKNIDFIDINGYPEFKDNAKTLFKDVVHTNKNGNAVIAKIINQYLENELL